jgi:hypothetical protein
VAVKENDGESCHWFVAASDKLILSYIVLCVLQPNIFLICVFIRGELGLIITGHESGEILVWHDALAWLQAACAAEAGNVRGNVEGEGEGDNGDADVSGKKKSKSKALRIKSHPSFAAPTSTTLHWHAHPGKTSAQVHTFIHCT